MLKPCRKPDLNAPRYKPKVYRIISPQFYKQFIKKYPEHKNIKSIELKKIILTFNEAIWRAVLDNRDGVDLPEGLGCIFIGTCQRAKRKNIHFVKSVELGVTVQNHNHNTDGKLAKIFYTNYHNRYKFKNRMFWQFIGVRDFKRTLAKRYPDEWKRYIEVSPDVKITEIYKKHLKRDYAKARDAGLMDRYDEFQID